MLGMVSVSSESNARTIKLALCVCVFVCVYVCDKMSVSLWLCNHSGILHGGTP